MAVNGPSGDGKPVGIALDLATERLEATFAPKISGGFNDPHDLAVSRDGSALFVTEISTKSPKKVYKFNVEFNKQQQASH